MKTTIEYAATLAVAIICLLTKTTAAQDDPLPPPDAPIKMIKPDRALIDRIRADFERLPPVLEVSYDYKESDDVGGPSFLARPKYLGIKLSGAALSFTQGKGLLENNLRCEPVFALWPYLHSSKDKQAFVLLMSITGEYFGHKVAPGSHMPFGSGFDESAWQARKAELLSHLASACRFVLEAGAESSFRRKYDFGDLSMEKLPADTTATPSTKPLEISPSNSSKTSSLPMVKPNQKHKSSGAQPGEVASNEEPTSSTPWSIIVVLIVAVIGLLWLLVKKRK